VASYTTAKLGFLYKEELSCNVGALDVVEDSDDDDENAVLNTLFALLLL
jgi:hypothetical protein